MDGFWVQVLVAVIAGFSGAGGTMAVVGLRFRRDRSAVSSPPPSAPPVGGPTTIRPDPWVNPMHRCEQAVCRAGRAVDAVSSSQARHALRSVVRRMDAELPNVRALVELGRGLEPGDSAAGRVYEQLDDAGARFTLITDHILAALAELVAEPDLGRVHQRVAALREQFPLMRPMSALLGPERSTSRSLIDVSA